MMNPLQIKVPLGKSHCSAAILATPSDSYFSLTTPSSYLNECGERYYSAFNGHQDMNLHVHKHRSSLMEKKKNGKKTKH